MAARVTVEVVGQPDPELLDAAKRAGEVLSELASLDNAVAFLVSINNDGARARYAAGIQRRLGEMRDKLRPVAHIDVAARRRAEADESETARRLALARASCVCDGHAHRGGKGGCYFGGTLVPACPCKWTDD